MANKLQNTSRKSPRRDTSKSLRQTVVQVRMSDEEIALLDTKRGTESRSRFLRHALYDGEDNRRKLVTVHVPEIERAIVEMNRIGVNVNQIARRWNAESKKSTSWATTSMLTRMDEDAKTLKEQTQKLQELNDKLARLEVAIRKQTMEMQLSKLSPEVRELLEGFGDPEHLPDLVDEILSEERYQSGGDV